jgi:hypothetical protein
MGRLSIDGSKTLPPLWTIIAAFFAAPTVAALVMACLEPLYAGLPSLADRIVRSALIYCLFGAYPMTLIFGVPAFFLLRRRLRPSALNCGLAGASVAGIPSLILAIMPNGTAESIDDGHVTVLHGHRTMWGWLFAGQGVLEMAAFGLLAGLVFWAIVAVGSKRSMLAPMSSHV